ncbi:hypothetical protein DPMN_148000 [Dreissena polymorpha]|uniref:Uncharacterized protein n=1 Tax=Dreissena polymorpha TaxID=45954 RepID=A0A9D4J3X1_DREPO|nr:hypothetical protein DPMN_148000 [Dreissena polymorpha]
MHLLDFILVLVLLPCIDAFQNKPIANNSCGYLEVKTPSLLFYGRNVTITFKAYKHKNATALLINNSDPTISHKPHHHDNQTDVFTFILHQNRTARRHQNYYVNNTCYSDTISFEMREPPALGPRKNIEGCDGCLIASVGDKADSLKNKEPLISCSMSNATSWTVFITINNKSGAARHYLHGKYVINYTVHEDDNMTMVKCFMTFSNLTLIDTAILYVKDDSATKIQHPSVTNVNDQTQSSKTFIEKSTQSTSTKSATDKQAVSTPRKPLSTTPRIVQTSAPSDALKTTENFISTTHTGHGKHDKRTDATSTTKSQPISNDANTDKKDTSVSNTSASNDGFQNVIIVVSCAVSAVIIVIAILIAVVCVKRKRRSGGKLYVKVETN